jgi:hypothetical protein
MLAEPNLAGDYFSEADYAQLYKIAPNIQAALERLETTATNVKKELKRNLDEQKKSASERPQARESAAYRLVRCRRPSSTRLWWELRKVG